MSFQALPGDNKRYLSPDNFLLFVTCSSFSVTQLLFDPFKPLCVIEAIRDVCVNQNSQDCSTVTDLDSLYNASHSSSVSVALFMLSVKFLMILHLQRVGGFSLWRSSLENPSGCLKTGEISKQNGSI